MTDFGLLCGYDEKPTNRLDRCGMYIRQSEKKNIDIEMERQLQGDLF